MTLIRDASTYRTLQYNLNTSSTALNQLYIKASTGVEVADASDDPAAVRTIMSCRSSIVTCDRYQDNCENVLVNLSSTEIYVDSVLEIMERAKEIAVSGGNDSLSEGDFSTYSDEVDRMRESLLDLANTRVGGRYLFAGYDDLSEPFSGDPVTYTGTSDHQMIAVASGTTVSQNVTGDELFMDPVDLFATLGDLGTALDNGDTSLISGQLTKLEEGAEQIRVRQSELGNSMARLEDLVTMHSSSRLRLEEKLAYNEETDLTSVFSEIAKMELSLEATMEVTGRVASLKLFNYL